MSALMALSPVPGTWQVLNKYYVLCGLGIDAADNIFKHKCTMQKNEYIIRFYVHQILCIIILEYGPLMLLSYILLIVYKSPPIFKNIQHFTLPSLHVITMTYILARPSVYSARL